MPNVLEKVTVGTSKQDPLDELKRRGINKKARD